MYYHLVAMYGGCKEVELKSVIGPWRTLSMHSCGSTTSYKKSSEWVNEHELWMKWKNMISSEGLQGVECWFAHQANIKKDQEFLTFNSCWRVCVFVKINNVSNSNSWNMHKTLHMVLHQAPCWCLQCALSFISPCSDTAICWMATCTLLQLLENIADVTYSC